MNEFGKEGTLLTKALKNDCGKRSALLEQILKMDLVAFKEVANLLKELDGQLQEDVELEKLSSHDQEIHEMCDELVLSIIELHIFAVEAVLDKLVSSAPLLAGSVIGQINELEEFINDCLPKNSDS